MAAYAGQALFIHFSTESKKMRNYNFLILIVLLGFISCETEPVETIYTDLGDKKGVFISCEGNFMYGNASLSFYDKVNRVIYNNVFFGRNRAPLGDVAHSLNSDGKHLYIVVNNSGKVVVIDKNTLEYRHTISGLASPRYVQFITREKAYISDLYDGKITLFNPQTFVKTGSINLSEGRQGAMKLSAEHFARIGNSIFVSCWNNNNLILEIDPITDTVRDSIKVPMQPRKMVVDHNNKLWVQCDGSFEVSPSGYEKPALVRIDPLTMTIEQIFRWEKSGKYAGDLKINPAKDSLYFIRDGLYKMAVSDRRLPEKPIIEARNRLFFSVGVDPIHGDIYLSDAIDYVQSALILRYTSAGTPVDSFRVGINPGNFWFN